MYGKKWKLDTLYTSAKPLGWSCKFIICVTYNYTNIWKKQYLTVQCQFYISLLTKTSLASDRKYLYLFTNDIPVVKIYSDLVNYKQMAWLFGTFPELNNAIWFYSLLYTKLRQILMFELCSTCKVSALINAFKQRNFPWKISECIDVFVISVCTFNHNISTKSQYRYM